jgi:hypothetical protein
MLIRALLIAAGSFCLHPVDSSQETSQEGAYFSAGSAQPGNRGAVPSSAQQQHSWVPRIACCPDAVNAYLSTCATAQPGASVGARMPLCLMALCSAQACCMLTSGSSQGLAASIASRHVACSAGCGLTSSNPMTSSACEMVWQGHKLTIRTHAPARGRCGIQQLHNSYYIYSQATIKWRRTFVARYITSYC